MKKVLTISAVLFVAGCSNQPLPQSNAPQPVYIVKDPAPPFDAKAYQEKFEKECKEAEAKRDAEQAERDLKYKQEQDRIDAELVEKTRAAARKFGIDEDVAVKDMRLKQEQMRLKQEQDAKEK